MRKTKIDWADSTWNPVTGCYHGCRYCYAKKIAERFKFKGIVDGQDEKIHDLEKPVIAESKNGKYRCPYPYGFEPTLYRYMLDIPMKWRKPRNIFVCSMADLFGDFIPDEWIDEVMMGCNRGKNHNYMFLTKNPKRYLEYPLPDRDNMWYGLSVTKEEDLQKIPSIPHTNSHLFLSVEPMLEDLKPLYHWKELKKAEWIIIGAETGNQKDKVKTRNMWVSRLVSFAKKNHIPIFMKDSLAMVVGKRFLIREFPWDSKEEGENSDD